MKRVLFILLLAALLTISLSPAQAQDYDWEYTFEFAGSDYCFNILDGGWQSGMGFISLFANPPTPARLVAIELDRDVSAARLMSF